MIKQLLKTRFDKWVESAIDITFTRIFTMSSLLGLITLAISIFYPEYSVKWETALAGILFYMRGKNADYSVK